MGQVIKGDVANIIKGSFLNLVSQAGHDGSGVYEMPIEMSSQMAKWLQLDNPSGKFSLARLKNGIMGYSPGGEGGGGDSSDNNKAFMFVVNCDEFHAKKPNAVDTSELQLFKMNYSNDSNQRIFINLGGGGRSEKGGASKCRYGTPPILPNQHTVQQVLNLIEYAMRHATLDSMKCYDYPQFCLQEHLNNLKNNREDDMHEVMRQAGAIWHKTIDLPPPAAAAAAAIAAANNFHNASSLHFNSSPASAAAAIAAANNIQNASPPFLLDGSSACPFTSGQRRLLIRGMTRC